MRKVVKFLLWLSYAPLQRLRLRVHLSFEQITSGLHWSSCIDVHSLGVLRFGRSTAIGRRTRISVPKDAELRLGDSTWLGDDCEIGVDSRVAIGSHTSIQHRSIILGDISIGAGCLCGPNLYMSSSIHRFEDTPFMPIRHQDAFASNTSNDASRSSKICIGEDCWIGINVVISPGVTVGRGCVIGANSVVTKDLPPYSVAAGAPAIPLRKRFDFNPPISLIARQPEHLPYFYFGFDQYGNDYINSLDTLGKNGWSARGEFWLAMAALGGQALQLHIEAMSEGKLKHGDQLLNVAIGKSVLNFQSNPLRHGFLIFEWAPIAHEGSGESAIIVHTASLLR